ncbi:43520_t:CDS:10 [Gigaspora margarita]|uniref:Glutamine synthetase n=1 Tax=Gigaspora margarita TaxID=4874 RepID=A0ABN7V1Q4_GIGMA|nr:43520_t:CDS:10 [Gigaspora margarita]
MTNDVYDREALFRIVSTFPLIDSHCHNLLTSDASLIYPLEVCFSEAHSNALKDALQTSVLKRWVRHLAEFYNCPPTLDSIKQVRDLMSHIDICKTCFKPTGIQSLLLDDGLDALGGLMDVQSHLELVDIARRIVRIESIAEKILYDLATSVACTDQKVLNFSAFEEQLKKQFETYAKSESVVAFKSIAAFESGLNINCALNPEAVAIALGNFISDFEPLIEKYPNAKFVILHAAYPYTRQAGYLASVYSNVYVDIGLVFPLISASGQQASLRELLEICPSNKILFSTDGHYHPESYYVAAIQGRETLSKVLLESVENGEFSYEEAIKVAKQIMFENSNSLYKLNLIPKQIDNEEYKDVSGKQRIVKLKKMGVKFVRIGFMECSNQYRFHIVPIDRFQNYIINSGLTNMRANTAFPYYGDVLPENIGVNETGELLLKPDLSTLIHLPYNPKHANVQVFFENKLTPADPQFGKIDNSPNSLVFPLCPRTCFKNIIESACKDLGITFLIGTEFEFVLLKGTMPPVPVDDTVYVEASSFHVSNSVEILDRIVEFLQLQGIEIEQFHSDGAPGKFKIVTTPKSPLIAADKVIVTRQTIYDVAAQAGVKATFVPKPFKEQVGTGAYVHLSFKEINKSQKIVDNHPSRLSPYERSFIAGVDGIKKGMQLTTNPMLDIPASLSNEESIEKSVTERMPASLPDALKALKEDKKLIDVLGEPIIRCYTGVKEDEHKYCKSLGYEEQLKILLMRY